MYLSLKRFTCSELDRFQYIVPLYINITRGTTYAGQWTQAISSLKLELSLQLKREKIQFQHFYPLSTPWWPPFPPCTSPYCPSRPTPPLPSQWQPSPTQWPNNLLSPTWSQLQHSQQPLHHLTDHLGDLHTSLLLHHHLNDDHQFNSS